MEDNKNGILADVLYYGGIFIVLLICYFIRKKLAGPGGNNKSFYYLKHYRHGIIFYNERKLEEAIDHFNIALENALNDKERQDCYSMIAVIFCEGQIYNEALKFATMSLLLNERSNDVCFEVRSKCYEENRQYKEALRDISVADEIRTNKSDDKANKKFAEKTNNLIHKYTESRTISHLMKNRLTPSKSKCSDFFKTFVGIIPSGEKQPDDIAYLIENNKFEELYEKFLGSNSAAEKEKFNEKHSSNGLFTYNLILCSIRYLCGNFEECMRILKNPQTDLETIFISYINAKNQKYNAPKDLLIRFSLLVNTDNPTVKFWLAKFYREIGNSTVYHELINSLSEYAFAYADILDFFIKNDDLRKIKEYEKESLTKFGSDNIIIYKLWEYYYIKRDRESLKEIIDKLDMNDSRSLYMKGLYCGLIKDSEQQNSLLKEALEKDPKYYEVLVHLGKQYRISDRKKYKEYFEKAIGVASCRREVYTCFEDLIMMDNREYVKNTLEHMR
ncbi:hypothetical protein NGRA_0318 [Nosema granulosis]|uniref:Uncharacterized protein n=1 Tax=Nosema granulosis TaxID=83296 RepID=A0A9P6H0K4_9MICR|nr:hypothetical protein NGRA_0318 [Nosema granulosis]